VPIASSALSAECIWVLKIYCALSAECTPDRALSVQVPSAAEYCVWACFKIMPRSVSKRPKAEHLRRMKNRESKSVWSRGYMFLGPILRKVGGVHPISHVGPKKLSWTFANLVQSSCQSYRQPDSGNLSTWYQRPDWGFKVRFAPSRIYKVNVLMSRNYHICVTNSLHLYQFQENVTIFRKSLKLNFSRNLAASPLS